MFRRPSKLPSVLTGHFCLLSLTQPEHSNVCFWYIPPSLRGLPPGPDRDTRLHQVSTEHQWFFWTRSVMVRHHCFILYWKLKMGEKSFKETDKKKNRVSYSWWWSSQYVYAGSSSDQSQDDGERLSSDWLSAFGSQSQFLQVCVLQSCHTARGHRLPARRDHPAGWWPTWHLMEFGLTVHVILKTIILLCHILYPVWVHSQAFLQALPITSSYALQPLLNITTFDHFRTEPLFQH